MTFEPAPATSPALAGAASGEKSAGVPTEKVTPPILPDEIRATVRPEDFLPYFQIPGSARRADDVTLLVPVPRVPNAQGSLPSSSATYTQTPK